MRLIKLNSLAEEDKQFGSTFRVSTLGKIFGNFGGLFGCRNPGK